MKGHCPHKSKKKGSLCHLTHDAEIYEVEKRCSNQECQKIHPKTLKRFWRESVHHWPIHYSFKHPADKDPKSQPAIRSPIVFTLGEVPDPHQGLETQDRGHKQRLDWSPANNGQTDQNG